LRNQNREKLNIESTRTLTSKISDPIQNRAWNCFDFFPKINRLTRFMQEKKKTDNKEIFEENNYLK